ncbi:MAG: pyridoxamine 5'-phosphate oxidase family protein [bacterium]|nr:pyridoxamine 5'-phosphate oxidase family protein [bacterium]
MGDIWDRERPIDLVEGETYREAIHSFISQYRSGTLSFLHTTRKNGLPAMRPVSTFVEGWTIQTVSQHHHVKLTHVRNNPLVGYLFLDAEGEPYNALGYTKNVWVAGRCEIVDDPDEIEAFFQRRAAATGQGDAHPQDQSYRRILMKTTPAYLRAEGFADHVRPIIYQSFPPVG